MMGMKILVLALLAAVLLVPVASQTMAGGQVWKEEGNYGYGYKGVYGQGSGPILPKELTPSTLISIMVKLFDPIITDPPNTGGVATPLSNVDAETKGTPATPSPPPPPQMLPSIPRDSSSSLLGSSGGQDTSTSNEEVQVFVKITDTESGRELQFDLSDPLAASELDGVTCDSARWKAMVRYSFPGISVGTFQGWPKTTRHDFLSLFVRSLLEANPIETIPQEPVVLEADVEDYTKFQDQPNRYASMEEYQNSDIELHTAIYYGNGLSISDTELLTEAITALKQYAAVVAEAVGDFGMTGEVVPYNNSVDFTCVDWVDTETWEDTDCWLLDFEDGEDDDVDLTTGEKVGIAIGTMAGVALLGTLSYMAWRRLAYGNRQPLVE